MSSTGAQLLVPSLVIAFNGLLAKCLRWHSKKLTVTRMRCEACHGTGTPDRSGTPCDDCGGSGVGHCCDGLTACNDFPVRVASTIEAVPPDPLSALADAPFSS